MYHFSSLDNEFNYRIFHFIGYFIWEKFSSILIFAQNGEKKLGRITPLLSFFSIYCTKKFSVYSRDVDSNEDSKTTVNYKNFRFQGRFIRENIQVFWHFCKMVKKNLGIVTPLQSFFSIYCTKKFSVFSRDVDSNSDSKTTVNYKIFRAPSKSYFLRNVFSQTMTKSDFFDDQENFSKTILPKNVGKFRALDPIQRRLDYFSKFFRDCSKKCRHI